MSILVYTLMVIFSLSFLINSLKINDILLTSFAKIGCVLTFLTLITGSF
jgi:hypothetical protein